MNDRERVATVELGCITSLGKEWMLLGMMISDERGRLGSGWWFTHAYLPKTRYPKSHKVHRRAREQLCDILGSVSISNGVDKYRARS